MFSAVYTCRQYIEIYFWTVFQIRYIAVIHRFSTSPVLCSYHLNFSSRVPQSLYQMANLVLTCFRSCFENSGFHTTQVNEKDNNPICLDTNYMGKYISIVNSINQSHNIVQQKGFVNLQTTLFMLQHIMFLLVAKKLQKCESFLFIKCF